jgi:hypothetical protein
MISAAECEQLVVGQEYLVPCINGMPVVGEPHIDDDHFNHTPVHYHCDSRFMSEPEPYYHDKQHKCGPWCSRPFSILDSV